MLGLVRRGLMLGGVMLLILTAGLWRVNDGSGACKAVLLMADSQRQRFVVVSDPHAPPYPIRHSEPLWESYLQGWSREGATLTFGSYIEARLSTLALTGRPALLTEGARDDAVYLSWVDWLPNGYDLVFVQYMGNTSSLYTTAEERRTTHLLTVSSTRETHYITGRNGQGHTLIQARDLDNRLRWYWLAADKATPTLTLLNTAGDLLLGHWWSDNGAWLFVYWEVADGRRLERIDLSTGQRQPLDLSDDWGVQFIAPDGAALYLVDYRDPTMVYRLTWATAHIAPFTPRGPGGPVLLGWRDDHTALITDGLPLPNEFFSVELRWLDTNDGSQTPLPVKVTAVHHWDAERQRLYYQTLVDGNTRPIFAVLDVATGKATPLVTRYRQELAVLFSPCGDAYLAQDNLPVSATSHWGRSTQAGWTDLPPSLEMRQWLDLPSYPWHPLRVGGGGVLLIGLGWLLRRRGRGNR